MDRSHRGVLEQAGTQTVDDERFEGPPWAGSRRMRSLLEGPRWSLVRVTADALALFIAVSVAGVLLFDPDALPAGAPLLVAYPPLAVLMLASRGFYRVDAYLPRLDAIARIGGATSVAAMVVIAVISLAVPESRPTFLVGPVWVLGGAALVATNLLLEWARSRARRQRVAGKPTLIVGAGKVGARLERRLKEQPYLGLNPIGFIDDADGNSTEGEGELLGHPSQLRSLIASTGAEHVILSFVRMPDSALLPLIRDCEELRVGVSVVPRFFETTHSRVVLEHIGGLPLFALRRVDPKGWQFALKHVFDRVAAGLLIAAFALLMVIIAIAVKLSSRGPLLYRQARIGRDGTEFGMLKFRTMRVGKTDARDFRLGANTAPGGVEGDDRRTGVGTLLRRTSLDELPQLFNVLRGDMSLIGPRPERPEYVLHFGENVDRYTDRHRVKSGMTGWAQVHGLRGQTSLTDRVEWDNYYIENWSLWLDVKILLMTLVAAARSVE